MPRQSSSARSSRTFVDASGPRGLVTSQRGPEGGFKFARDPDSIMIADILRVVSGPMAGVRGMRPETLVYEGEAKHLRESGSRCAARCARCSST